MKNLKAYALIDAILILTAILGSMIEYAIATAIDFHYPAWTIYPAAIRGMTMHDAYAYCISQPWWWAALIISVAILLMTPKFIYPILCDFTGREK